MATQKQIEANRRNAQKSTGPRTAEGKSRSRWNSLRHGLVAEHEVLPQEDSSVYEEMRAELLKSWQPANTQEVLLVDEIAQGWWVMERARRFENDLFEQQLNSMGSLGDKDTKENLQLLLRYAARAEAKYYRAMDHLRQLQKDRIRRAEREERDKRDREKHKAFLLKNPPRFIPAGEPSPFDPDYLNDDEDPTIARVRRFPPDPGKVDRYWEGEKRT